MIIVIMIIAIMIMTKNIIEPAEPEPPPAHSIGSVGEDVMGRSGQLVRPCWLDAGGVAGGEELVARLVGRLVFFIVFSTFLVVLGKKNRPKSLKRSKPKKKTKMTKKLPKPDHHLFDLGAQNEPKIHQKEQKNGIGKTTKKISLQNFAFLVQVGVFGRKTSGF